MNNKNTSKTRFLGALIIAANVGIVSLPLLAQPKPPASTLPAGTAAEVNGEKIPNEDVERRLARVKAGNPVLQADSAQARQALQEIRKSIIEEIIDFRLRVQEAKKQKLVPTVAQIDGGVTAFREQFKLTTDAQAKTFLAEQGKSLGDLRQLVTDSLMVNALEARWTAPIKVSEDEIAEAYRANIDHYIVPEGVSARHILVAFGKPNPSAQDKAVALKKAQDLLRQAKTAGVDFGTLAKANSDDPGSKDRGGDLGSFPRGLMIEPFEKAAFGAKVGDIVGPIETTFGYHLIKVEKKTAGRTVPLQEPQVREESRVALLEQKRELAVANQAEALLKAAKVKRNS